MEMPSPDHQENNETAKKRKRKGNKMCIHSRQERRCKDCGGKEICGHGLQRSRCRECGGSEICIHAVNRWSCKACGGPAYCIHSRVKSRCGDCRGSSICPHNRVRYSCVDCAGRGICEHRRRRQNCKQCLGSSICAHGVSKSMCLKCGVSSSICKHKKIRSYCVDCMGGAICEHRLRRLFCFQCKGSKVCSSCNQMLVNKVGSLCSYCSPQVKKNSRIKEVGVVAQLEEWASQFKIPSYSTWNKQNPLSDPEQCVRYRVDIVYNQDVFVLALEVDENQHKFYERDCELVRQAKIALSYGGKPVRFVRYNPDGFQVGRMTRRTMKEERMRTLLGTLQEIFGDASWIYQDEKQESMYFMILDYLFYDPILPGSAGGLVQTFKFATVEEYEAWAEMIAPGVAMGDGVAGDDGVAEDDGGNWFSFFLE